MKHAAIQPPAGIPEFSYKAKIDDILDRSLHLGRPREGFSTENGPRTVEHYRATHGLAGEIDADCGGLP